ncbi:alpha-L-arabinofuranosidase [candidate division KSB1 bacterium]|nr:alpha-L-arabinofuranosidase [candidate division KSB1 bacterium]RQW06071.1 MAG: alpha-L-arabinofuranosidase [candidate division KSB1 bacterium]
MNSSVYRRTMWLLATLACMVGAQPQLTVNVGQPGATISPTMYGIFFEDINFAADGGLYAELVKNRSFEFDRPLQGWQILKKSGADARILILRDETRPRNPRFVRMLVNRPGQEFGLSNEGFRGMGIRQNADYRFSIAARQVAGDIHALRIELVNEEAQSLAHTQIEGFSSDWQTYHSDLTSDATALQARLNIWVEGRGTLDIDVVSLFPKDTWKGRENGLRPDLVQLLADMQPGFLRFPGGCIVEGFDLSQRYQWKNTLGPINERILNINRWNFEFKHRQTPDYYQSYGLGFYEYFLLAEDLGAEPMPIINCGMACQFNTAELTPMDQLDPYVQDAIDLIEFANGPTESNWGTIRAQMGHPEPFNMKMIGIGNEQWGPQYVERYKVFAKTIKDKYPDMQLIAATGSDGTIFPNGEEEIEYLWSFWSQLKPDIVDEHFYRKPEWFLENTGWYNSYDRTGPKLFVGEYASQSVGVGSPENRNSWKCALYEAAFMTGLERNADLVTMTCYAPLFGHEQAWQWRPDLIWFDNLISYGSANYYVQKLFGLHPGTHVLAIQIDGNPNLEKNKKGLHASATLDKRNSQAIIKVVNVADNPVKATINLHDTKLAGSIATVILLTSKYLTDENSLNEPRKIYPEETSLEINSSRFMYTFKPISLTILRVPVR